MIEHVVHKNGKKIVEVRSSGGSLLFVKTEEGYEIKCRKTKEICIVKYEEMFADCLRRFFSSSDDHILLSRAKEIRDAIDESKDKSHVL